MPTIIKSWALTIPGSRPRTAGPRRASLYESVLYFDGSNKRAYAMTDAKEYFAELTESWFGTNDFYPFVRAEVLKHDPQMAELLKKIGGSRTGILPVIILPVIVAAGHHQ